MADTNTNDDDIPSFGHAGASLVSETLCGAFILATIGCGVSALVGHETGNELANRIGEYWGYGLGGVIVTGVAANLTSTCPD